MNWQSVAMCESCWREENPQRDPVRMKSEYAKPEPCAVCGTMTNAGIYMRREIRGDS